MNLARPRQVALLKRAAHDGYRVATLPMDETTDEHRVSTYEFQGQQLRVESRVSEGRIDVLDVAFV